MEEHNETIPTLFQCLIQHNEKQMPNQGQASMVTSSSTLTAIYQPTTTSILLEENIRKTIATGSKPTVASRSPVPLRTSSCLHLQSTLLRSEHQLNVDETIDPSSARTSPVSLDRDESKRCPANASSSQRQSKTRRLKSAKKGREVEQDVERTTDTDASPLNITSETHDYKSPFTKEYDQAILLQAQVAFSNNPYEWNLKDFYREVKTPFEPETNTKEVFEKCLKLARLQANTIRSEQRRRPNDTVHNRPVKSAALDRTTTLPLSKSLSPKPSIEKDPQEISELRCFDCKRPSCVGNCTASQECPAHKRLSPSSLSPNLRDATPGRLQSRSARTAFHLRPRTGQQATRETRWRSEQTKLNPVVIVPSFDHEGQTKRPQTPFPNGFLPGKLIRAQRRETLTLVPAHRASS